MKYFAIILLLSFTILFGCDGDCMACHPNLAQKEKLDTDHKVLLKCKICHSKEKLKDVDIGGVCGGNCWQCHDISKVTKVNIQEHKVLNKCKTCHFDIDKKASKQKLNKPNLMDLIKSRDYE